jgi:acyl-CoA dehydrogenase
MANDSLVAETARRIFRDVCDPQALNRAVDDSWVAPAWRALEEAGLPLAWVPEALGGADAGLADGFAVLREAGRAAVPLPLAETLLAGWLLAEAGIPAPKGAISCGPTRKGDKVLLAANGTLRGQLRAVPQARHASHLAILAEQEQGGLAVALVEAAAAQIADGTSLADDALNAVRLDGVRPLAVETALSDLDPHALMLMGGTARAMQMAGALEAILDIAVAYANERVAFGKPIGKFQAVQQSLARLAGEVAAAIAASGSAADTMAEAEAFDDAGVFLEVASAKIRVGEAAGEGAAIAHQVLGAIGFTREHILHRFTRRLWAWRDDFGNESQWAAKLGELVAAKGADALWPMLAAR